jgi:predicted Fe-Mo cluster-binding NifX family protein
MIYAIPTDDGKTMGPAFGRALHFAVMEEDEGAYSLIENTGASSEHGAGIGAAALLAERGVGCVLAPEVGPKAEAALKSAHITIRTLAAGTPLAEAFKAILKEEGK